MNGQEGDRASPLQPLHADPKCFFGTDSVSESLVPREQPPNRVKSSLLSPNPTAEAQAVLNSAGPGQP